MGRGEGLTDAAFAPALVDAEHGDVASVGDVLVHALLAHDHAYRDGRSGGDGLQARMGERGQRGQRGQRGTHEERELGPGRTCERGPRRRRGRTTGGESSGRCI